MLSQRAQEDQQVHPVAFLSRRFSPAERNYDVGNRELLAMHTALEEWRHWLEGAQHPVLIWTDHKNLTYIREAKRLGPRQARWALLFSRFNFTLTYQPGSKNVRADALSRLFSSEGTPSDTKPQSILPPARVVGVVTWGLESAVRVAQRGHVNPAGGPHNRLFIPESVRSRVLQWGHSSGSPATPEPPKRASSSGGASGGPPWRLTSGSSSRRARSAPGARLPIGPLRDCFDLFPFPVDHGPTWLWTLSPGSLHP